MTLLAACQPEQTRVIQLQVGNAPELQRSFEPRTALVEVLRIPDSRTELRLTLADYETPCGEFVPAADGRTNVSVLVVTPAGTDPTPGTYAWAGRDAHGGTPSRPERPFAMPKAYLGAHSHLFPPGGSLRLTQAPLEHEEYVEGVLAFEFPGDAQRQATSLRGNFRARICKTSP